jgi:DNA-3-methyladenine glycosylase I
MSDNRCSWAETNELLTAYHDTEWGVPVHDDRLLFEMLNLEGAQAGLSWLTILARQRSPHTMKQNGRHYSKTQALSATA